MVLLDEGAYLLGSWFLGGHALRLLESEEHPLGAGGTPVSGLGRSEPVVDGVRTFVEECGHSLLMRRVEAFVSEAQL